jgi:hypothetical protein
MQLLLIILAELARPDDQGTNWYAWATAQCGHALLGAMMAAFGLLLGQPALAVWLVVGVAYALIKELPDYAIAPGWRAARDSLRDALFVAGGAGLAAALYAQSAWAWVAMAAIAAGLIIGVMQRARAALRATT